MKKVWLLLTIMMIFYLSNTPSLRVSTPETWINEPQYEKNLGANDIFHEKSVFFSPYLDVVEKEFILHKISHIVFFGLLAFLFFINLKKNYFLAWICTTFFAFTDEIHQYFVIGRSGRALDILLDSLAAVIVLCVVWIIRKTKN